jgi:PadR family transcriptional regulator PadR
MGIARRITQITNGTFVVKAGSLFPALHRMEQAGWLMSSWGESETNRRAKFYRLTKSGKSQFQTEAGRWERISLAMASALRTT